MLEGKVKPRPGIDGSNEWSRYGYSTFTSMQSCVEPSPQCATVVTVQVRTPLLHVCPDLPVPIAAFTALMAAASRSLDDAVDGATAAARAPSAALCDSVCRK